MLLTILGEVEELSNLARALGYYVPSAGTGFRKLEHIESHANSLVVISKTNSSMGLVSIVQINHIVTYGIVWILTDCV